MDKRINQNLLSRVKELEANPNKYPIEGVLWYHCGDGYQSLNQDLENWACETCSDINGVAIVSNWQDSVKIQYVLNPADFHGEWDEYDQAYDELLAYCE